MGTKWIAVKVCDECEKESPVFYTGTSTVLGFGWGHSPALKGWLSIKVQKSDAEILQEAKSLFGRLGGSNTNAHYVCSKKCATKLKKRLGISKEQIINEWEMGNPPPEKESRSAFDFWDNKEDAVYDEL